MNNDNYPVMQSTQSYQVTPKNVSDFNIVCSMGHLSAADQIIDCRPCGNNQIVLTYLDTGSWVVFTNTGTAYQVLGDEAQAMQMHQFLNYIGAPNTVRYGKQTILSSYCGR